MKVLLSNDDGFDAPGIKAIKNHLKDNFDVDSIVSVAPNRCYSQCSHQINTSKALKLTEIGEEEFHLDGSPADCVRVGLTQICPDADWVISGINEGDNLGLDVYLSGTVAAAREACIMGKKAIAISQYFKNKEQILWSQSANIASQIFKLMCKEELGHQEYLNVNLPVCEDERDIFPMHSFTPLCKKQVVPSYQKEEDGYLYNSVYSSRPQEPGSDVALCFSGQITISRLKL